LSAGEISCQKQNNDNDGEHGPNSHYAHLLRPLLKIGFVWRDWGFFRTDGRVVMQLFVEQYCRYRSDSRAANSSVLKDAPRRLTVDFALVLGCGWVLPGWSTWPTACMPFLYMTTGPIATPTNLRAGTQDFFRANKRRPPEAPCSYLFHSLGREPGGSGFEWLPASKAAGSLRRWNDQQCSTLYGAFSLNGCSMRSKMRGSRRHKFAGNADKRNLLSRLTEVHKLREQVRVAEAKRRLPSR
jgi:hypothetical protein